TYAKSVIDEPLSIELIQRFNQVATQNVCENDHVAGMIRDTPIAVKDVLYNETIHEAPDADKLGGLLYSLCEFANTEHLDNEFIHPIVKAIILHFMVGYIHPFSDGNGRTARALFYWFLLKSGYDNFQYVSISSLLKSSKNK
ncbi:Fic family protein, partial [Vibrio sp. 10N.261.45.A4]